MDYVDRLIELRKRNRAVLKARRKGMTLDAIAKAHGISLQRVWQIVDRDRKSQQ